MDQVPCDSVGLPRSGTARLVYTLKLPLLAPSTLRNYSIGLLPNERSTQVHAQIGVSVRHFHHVDQNLSLSFLSVFPTHNGDAIDLTPILSRISQYTNFLFFLLLWVVPPPAFKNGVFSSVRLAAVHTLIWVSKRNACIHSGPNDSDLPLCPLSPFRFLISTLLPYPIGICFYFSAWSSPLALAIHQV